MAKRVTAIAPVDELWALPTGWRWERLGSVASTVGGGRLKFNKSHYVESGYPAYSAAGQDGLLDRWEFDGEAVVLSSIGARCGKSFYAKGRWASLANTQCIMPDSELNARYLWYYTNNEERWERSGSAQPFIKPSTIKSLPIPLPPLEVQRRIVARMMNCSPRSTMVKRHWRGHATMWRRGVGRCSKPPSPAN
jgi:type I restriction enzyme S subunit